MEGGGFFWCFKISNCGYKTNTKNELEFHTESMHQETVENGFVHQKERGVCKFFRQGRCNRQRCSFRHPESLATVSQQRHFSPACTRGQTCSLVAQNRCHYFHPGVVTISTQVLACRCPGSRQDSSC